MAESTDLIPDSDDEEDDMRCDSDAPDTYTNIVGSRQRVHIDHSTGAEMRKSDF